mgnify:CR=1 FL=1
MKILGHLFMLCKLRYPSKRWLSDMQTRIFDIHADFFCGENVMGLQAKNEDGVVVSTPSFQLCLSYDYQVRKEMGKLINQGETLKVALDKALKDTTIRERFFTTPCALQVRSAFPAPGSGNHWDPAQTLGSRGKSRGAGGFDGNSATGKGQASKKQKKGKGKGGKGGSSKGGKGVSALSPDGREICYAFNSEGCQAKNCHRIHCCRRCFGKHPMTSCTAAPAAAPSPAAAGAAGASSGG